MQAYLKERTQGSRQLVALLAQRLAVPQQEHKHCARKGRSTGTGQGRDDDARTGDRQANDDEDEHEHGHHQPLLVFPVRHGEQAYIHHTSTQLQNARLSACVRNLRAVVGAVNGRNREHHAALPDLHALRRAGRSAGHDSTIC